MVKDPVCSIVVRVRSTNDANERQILTVSSGDSVDYAETTNGKGNNASSDATGAGIAVGGVAGVELVAATNKVELRLGDEVVEQSQIEVAGNREHVGDADLHQPPCKVAAERGITARHRRRRNRWLDSRAVRGGA